MRRRPRFDPMFSDNMPIGKKFLKPSRDWLNTAANAGSETTSTSGLSGTCLTANL
jgi:hypothetical protein